eukprot:CAMPEP_0177602354 /NCGR_PEP_ID=MMETSP0419_2-20121207/14812_1 /TAXON_ID=582737 /ORGANISM="Tetraselmis sp., Strain GSL018" /LENGTH=248 /DNA_ID=CAMNT_0019095809 /DNA_START=147 /DNA_END=893 /DNA_ORIENTATION=-
MLSGAALLVKVPSNAHAAKSTPLQEKFMQALSASDDLERAVQLWGEALDLAPDNSAAWSNRGTVFLQAGRWREARDDLAKARALDEAQRPEGADPLVLNNLANAEGALGNWDAAIALFREAAASDSRDVQEIALANLALALFQVGREDSAIREARQLLRRDSEFLDMRAGLAGFLWASGEEEAAEAEWDALQRSQGGLGGEIYSRATAVSRVQARWPPRCTAALQAFLSLKREGYARDYDGQTHYYEF